MKFITIILIIHFVIDFSNHLKKFEWILKEG